MWKICEKFHWFFGVWENKIICVQNLLTFRWKLSLMMKIYTNWAFLKPVANFAQQSLCVKFLQILFQLELYWFWIEGNGRFWFLLFMYHCVVKSSVCTALLNLHITTESLDIVHEVRINLEKLFLKGAFLFLYAPVFWLR